MCFSEEKKNRKPRRETQERGAVPILVADFHPCCVSVIARLKMFSMVCFSLKCFGRPDKAEPYSCSSIRHCLSFSKNKNCRRHATLFHKLEFGYRLATVESGSAAVEGLAIPTNSARDSSVEHPLRQSVIFALDEFVLSFSRVLGTPTF